MFSDAAVADEAKLVVHGFNRFGVKTVQNAVFFDVAVGETT